MFSFSIVINTLNRAHSLLRTLESLRWLRYAGKFEVIVVNGPSIDETENVIESWRSEIRPARCPEANLSMSRNIGIGLARGEIVAFIDDDAIPEPEWLEQLSDGYGYRVAGVGGAVYDDTGHTFQYLYSTANRLGRSKWNNATSREDLCVPRSFEFPYLQGTNASFRREALLQIGGFDEEFEYYLDETDVCCRLIDQGFIVRQVANAFVHHKFAPSAIRDNRKILLDRYPIIKNKIYFSRKHATSFLREEDILLDNKNFSNALLEDVKAHIAAKRVPESELARFEEQNVRAWDVGTRRGAEGSPRLPTVERLRQTHGDFKLFPTHKIRDKRAYVVIDRDNQPLEKLQRLASTGRSIFLITKSSHGKRVDFVKGVWVHSIASDMDSWEFAAAQEVDRIGRRRPVSIL